MEPELPGRVRPVIATTLRFLSKAFPLPMNLQYAGKGVQGGQLFSDGNHLITCSVGESYKKLFKTNRFKENQVFTIFQATRERVAPYKVCLTNMMVAAKQFQVEGRIGQPIPY